MSASLLYDILRLREDVFIVEQNAVYTDIDGLDRQALHLCVEEDEDRLIGYLRLLPPGVKFQEASIGRIVIRPDRRGGGLGRDLVRRGIAEAARAYGDVPLRIEAQEHLRPFYESFGFAAVSAPYDWGGLPHVQMVLK